MFCQFRFCDSFDNLLVGAPYYFLLYFILRNNQSGQSKPFVC